MTTTKQSWLKRSLAVLLAVMMVMSMGVADVFAVEPSGTMLTDGTYKVPFSFNYYMAGQMYEMAAGKPNALIQTPATIEVKDGKMTVTLSAVKDGTDYVTKFQYRLQDDENYTEAAVSDTDKDGNVDQISFTIDYTEDYLVTTVHYTSSVEAGFESALCFDFSKAEMEGGDQPPVEGDTEATHTIKLKVDSAKAAEIIKIPDDDGSIMTSNGGIDNAISAYTDEVELVEKDGEYTLLLRMARTGMMSATMEDFHIVEIDPANSENQTHTTITPIETTYNGVEIYEFHISLGTEEQLGNPIYMWCEASASMGDMSMSFYSKVEITPQINYLIDLAEEPMIADGSYTGKVTVEYALKSQYDKYFVTDDVVVDVKDGKATLRLIVNKDYVYSKTGNLYYAIYGKETSSQTNTATLVPVSGEKQNYVFLETSDLRRPIYTGTSPNTNSASNGLTFKVDKDSLQRNDNPEAFEMLDDGNYTADIEVLNADGNASELASYFQTAAVPVKSENGKMTVTLNMTKTGLENFKQNIYAEDQDLPVTPISGSDLSMVDITLYYKGDTALLTAEENGNTISFQVKLKQDTVEKVQNINLLPDGDYTVDIQCLKDISNDESMSGNYFDKEAVPVKVEDGKVYMTLTIKTESDDGTMSNLVQGLKHKVNGEWVVDDPQPTEPYPDGIDRITETIEIDSLEEPTYVQVYVTAMGWWATLRIVPDLNTIEGDNLGDMLAVPEVSTNPNTYTGMYSNDETVMVTLSTAEEDSEIYYTVDGSLPVVGTAKTFRYTGSFAIKTASAEMNTVTVKAITYKNGEKSFSKSYDIIFLAQEEEPVIAATEPGIYAVPYRIWKAFEQDYSMADDAVDGDMIVQVYEDEDGTLKSNYYMTVKERDQDGIVGHLIRLWNIPGTDAPTGAPNDYELDEQKADVLTTVNEAGLDETNADYPRVLKFTRDSSGEEYFYIRVDVDAMGDTHQSAKIVMDWDNAQKATLPDGVYEVEYSIMKAFEQDYSMANDVIDGPMTVEISNGAATYTLKVKARNQDGIIGHLLQLWNIPGTDAPTGAPDDYELDSQLAEILSTVNEEGLDGTKADYGNVFEFTRDTTGEDYFYIRVNVDAMGDDHQSAKLVPNWSTATWLSEAGNQVATPVLTNSSSFTESIQVSITCATEGANIYYTLDGSVPSISNGIKYTGEFTVLDTTTVKAIAVREGLTDSAVASATYTKDSNTDPDDNEKPVVLEPGRYTTDVQLWHAYSNQASMGNVAFADVEDMLVVEENGKYILYVATKPVRVSGYTTAITDMACVDGSEVTVEETSFFTTNTKYDGTAHELEYIKVFSIELDSLDTEYVNMKMKVPYTPMDAVGAATDGWLSCRLKIDLSDAVKVSDDYELNPSEDLEEQSPAVNLTDSTTGIKIQADEGVLPEGVKLVVTQITSDADYDRAASILSDVGKKFRLFEIHFELDGAEVQPNGIVTVYYPIPEGYDADKVVLYRINDDGTKTLVKGTVENGFYKVMTKSFSTYALVEQGSTITDAENSANVGSDIPQTGDSTNVLPFALLALASAGMIGVLFVSRKRKFTEGE